MPTYHSAFNEVDDFQVCCKAALLPIKTKIKGPAPPCRKDELDVIDETLDFFRANVLYRNFEPKGAADLTLCYLTIFTGECLRVFAKCPNKEQAKKNITAISHSQNFPLPGDNGFCLNGFFSTPDKRSDADLLKQYLRQAREELSLRLVEIAFNEDGSQNKWWIQFQKRAFMGVKNA